VPLPEFGENEEIIRLECGKRTSAVITNHGKIWITGNYKSEKQQK
jgi:alpha-tubulin suppressor-like RCC1 family protein